MRHLLFITQVLNTATSHTSHIHIITNFSHYKQFVSYYICTKHSKFLISPLAFITLQQLLTIMSSLLTITYALNTANFTHFSHYTSSLLTISLLHKY